MVPAPIDQFLRTYLARQPRTGPIALFGLIWFGLVSGAAVFASLVGAWPIAIVFGVVGAVAALQASSAWKQARASVNQLLAALGVTAMTFASLGGNRLFAVIMIVIVVLSLILGEDSVPDVSSLNAEAIGANLITACATLRVALPLGVLGASMVQAERASFLTLAMVIAVVCVYDAGHYLIGTTLRNRFGGILAGLAGNIVVVFAVSAVNPPPFDGDGSARMVAAVAALACPLGQWLGSFMLPNALVKAPALRRLDAWLVTGPLVWLFVAVVS